MSSGFQYPAFISYRNGVRDLPYSSVVRPSKFTSEFDIFAKKLCDKIQSKVASHVKENKLSPVPFLDQHNHDAPHEFTKLFGEAITRSVCMIIIHTDNYLDPAKPFCASEYKKMLEVEEHRNSTMGYKGDLQCIYPILLGEQNVPKRLVKALYVSFANENFESSGFWKKGKVVQFLKDIAKYVYYKLFTEVYKEGAIEGLFDCCENSELDNDLESLKLFINTELGKIEEEAFPSTS